MKSILFILLCASSLYSSVNMWKTAGGWINTREDTDSLVMDSGTVDWVLDGNEVCESFTRLQGFGGNIDLSGDTITVTGQTFYTDAIYGSGYTYGPGCINIAGDAAVTLINRNYNGIYETGTINWVFGGNNLLNQPQYGIAPLRVDWCYPGKTVTTVAGSIPGWDQIKPMAGHPSVVFHGGRLINNALLQIITYGNEPLWVGSPDSVLGSGKIYGMVLSGSYRITAPKLITTNDFYAYLSTGSGSASLTFTDTIDCDLLYLYADANNSVYFNGAVVRATAIATEVAPGSIYCASRSVYTRSVTLNMPIGGRFDMDGMTMTCHGNWTNTGHPTSVIAGSSTITFDTTCTVTSGMSIFNIIRLDNPAGTTVTSDGITMARFIYDTGSGDVAGTWISCGTSSISPTWGRPGDTITATGSYSGNIRFAFIDDISADVVSDLNTPTTTTIIVPEGISSSSSNVVISQTDGSMSDTLWYGFCCVDCEIDSVRPFRQYVNQYAGTSMMIDIRGAGYMGYSAGNSYVIINSVGRSDTLRRPALWTDTHITDTLLSVIPRGPKSVQVRRSDGTVSTVGSRNDSLYLYQLRNR